MADAEDIQPLVCDNGTGMVKVSTLLFFVLLCLCLLFVFLLLNNLLIYNLCAGRICW